MRIKETIPQVEERVSYGTTVMFSLGHDLVGFVSQPKHLSFVTASPKLAQVMKDEITKTHEVSGATIHFSPGHPLPTGSLFVIHPSSAPHRAEYAVSALHHYANAALRSFSTSQRPDGQSGEQTLRRTKQMTLSRLSG